MKKMLSLLLVLCMSVSLLSGVSFAATVIDSGTCGENLTWTLDDAGTFTISGTGAMTDYTSSLSAPWYSNRHSLRKVVIESGVTTIGSEAFSSCYYINSVTIGNSVTTIGDSAFFECYNLTNITVDSENQNYCDVDGILFNKDKTTLIQYPIGKTESSYTIPNSVITIGDSAFRGCRSLINITIPDSVTMIEDSAFFECDNLTNVTVDSENEKYCDVDGVLFDKEKTVLVQYPAGKTDSSYIIPNGVTTIMDHAFYSCESLTDITIPESVTTIGSEAFRYCHSLAGITIPEGVTTIGERTFYLCDSLTSVTIPNGVTTIGPYAFHLCGSLTSITIPDSVTTIGEGAFSDSGITSITIPDGVTTIGDNVFWYCMSLASIIIPDSVTTIGNGAFAECSSLTSITIPDGVTTIGDAAFDYCYRLTSITIPDSVTTIGKSAFFYCNSLTSITIPDSVTTIGDYAFSECHNLANITIPESVTTIGDYAFQYCSDLADVYYTGTEAKWKEISIGDYNEKLTTAKVHFLSSEISISTVNGAQVRTRGKQGLRFISTIAKTGDFSKIKEYGTILVPTADITDVSEFVLGATLNGHAVAKVPAKHLYEETETSLTFTAVITDIKPKNYNRAYSARAYAILEDGTVVYSDVVPSRDVYSIAGKVLSNEELDADATAFLQSVLRYVDGITIAIDIPEPKEDAQVPLEIEVDGCETTIGWTRTGGAAHTGTFESGTTYTATVTLTSDILFSPNDKVLWNNESITYTLSDDRKTITVIKSYDFKDSGYSGIY